MSDYPAAVVVLAAGQGTRMKSATTPKVLHAVCGRTLVGHVLAACAQLRPAVTAVVVGHGRDAVRAHLAQVAPDAVPVVQDEQNGTGHAVRVALAALPPLDGTVVVVPGDAPLLTGETLTELVRRHQREGNAVTLLTAELADPTGYGRVVRDSSGAVSAIVEQRDADAATLAIREVGTSVYAFDGAALVAGLARLTTDNAQGEEYLTDVVAHAVAQGDRVGAFVVADPVEASGVNDRAQLAAAGAALRERIVRRAMLGGVTVVDPSTTWIDETVVLQADSVVLPFSILAGATVVEAGAVVGPNTRLTDTVVRAGAVVDSTVAYSAEIGPGANVGPFAYLRPGTVLAAKAKAGTFVEVKNSTVGEGAKVPHLTYVGDATIGAGTNIGASSVFVNYDGVKKHRTVIGEHCRTGSDTMFVAPVTIGDGAYTAAGSVITDDVPPGAMAVARARQRNITGWTERRREGTPSAQAAARARAAESNGPAAD